MGNKFTRTPNKHAPEAVQEDRLKAFFANWEDPDGANGDDQVILISRVVRQSRSAKSKPKFSLTPDSSSFVINIERLSNRTSSKWDPDHTDGGDHLNPAATLGGEQVDEIWRGKLSELRKLYRDWDAIPMDCFLDGYVVENEAAAKKLLLKVKRKLKRVSWSFPSSSSSSSKKESPPTLSKVLTGL